MPTRTSSAYYRRVRLPSTQATTIGGIDYGTRSSVRSLVHLEKNGSRSIVGGIRCYNDKNAAERIAEDAAAKPINGVETAGV